MAITLVSCATGAIALAGISFAIAMWHDLIDLGVRLNKTKKEDNNYKQIQYDFIAKFFSCVGMTLLALSAFTPLPVILIAGTVVCTTVASYYAGKHFWNAVLSSYCPRFFFSSHSKPHSSSFSATDSQLPTYIKSPLAAIAG